MSASISSRKGRLTRLLERAVAHFDKADEGEGDLSTDETKELL